MRSFSWGWTVAACVACGGGRSSSTTGARDASAFDATEAGFDGAIADGTATKVEGGTGYSDGAAASEAGCPIGNPSCAAIGAACCPGNVCGGGLACRGGFCQSPPAADTGAPCSADGECPSGVCQPVEGVEVYPDAGLGECTTACTSSADCVAGWTCGPAAGRSGSVCQCVVGDDYCNGTDSDCDGVVDDEPLADTYCNENKGTGQVCQAGTCTCLLTCGGTCVDSRSDSSNCGACGVTCDANTQACVGGACTCLDGLTSCALEGLASGQNSPLSVAVYGGTVHWANGGEGSSGSIMSVAEDGGTPFTVASGQGEPIALAVDATGVYWGTGGGALLHASLDGGSSVTVANGNGSGSVPAVVLDETNVYWTVENSGILAAPKNALDGGVMTLVDAGARSIALASGALYWVSSPRPVASGTLMKVPVDGGAPVVLAPVGPGAVVGAADSANVYVVFSIGDVATNGVVAYPLDGGAPTTLASFSTTAATNPGVVSDGTNVYFTNGGTGSDVTILKASVTCPSGAITVVTGQTGSYDQPLAIDGDTLYFVASGSSTFGDTNGVVAKVSPR